MRKIFFTFLLFPVFCLAQNKNTIRAKVEKAFEIVGNILNHLKNTHLNIL